MSLRAELVEPTAGLPGFALVLPEGWGAFDPDPDVLRARAEQSLGRLSAAQRTALRPVIDEVFASARRGGADLVRLFAQAEVPESEYLPVSLVAARMDAPGGRSLAEAGRHLIATRGAAPLDEGGTILRWTQSSTAGFSDGAAEVLTINYLLPAPGTEHRGLLFQASILASAGGVTVDPTGVATMSALCDAIVATVRWKRDA